MTITELEFVWFVAFVVMTAMWFRMRAELYMHMGMTEEIFMRIAKGNMKVTETEDGFELEVTPK